MDIYVLNKDLETIGVIDTYMSVIWTSRYYASGDFELCVVANSEMLGLLKKNYYLVRDKDVLGNEMHNVMLIKNIELQADPENGNQLIITGQDLKSIVGQRVIISQTSMKGQLKECIHLVLFENIIDPLLNARAIENFKFERVEGFETYFEKQVTGDNLGEFISGLCEENNIGWDVFIRDGNFIFNLYQGVDRSYNQSENPYVVFSGEFDNLLNSDYQYLTEEYKNVAIVAGEGEGVDRKKTIVGNATGLDRFELWVDAQSTSSNEGIMTENQYLSMLQAQGNEALSEYINNELFDGEADTTTQYVLNRDFFLGDIVQVENDYGISAMTRILEVIESEDDSGTSVIPTFSTMILENEPITNMTTHGDLRAYTHGELSQFTHKGIAEGAL